MFVMLCLGLSSQRAAFPLSNNHSPSSSRVVSLFTYKQIISSQQLVLFEHRHTRILQKNIFRWSTETAASIETEHATKASKQDSEMITWFD